MSTPEQEDPGQYATPEEIEDLEATAEDQENVTGGTGSISKMFGER